MLLLRGRLQHAGLRQRRRANCSTSKAIRTARSTRGHLCPKGSAIFGLTVNEQRWTTVKYRAPYSDRYEERPLEWALERIAQHVKKTRDETFAREWNGKRVNHTLGIASLGGATFAIEENYMLGKLMHSFGVVSIENQARI